MATQVIGQLMTLVGAVSSAEDLNCAMIELCSALGFQFFALTHHVDISRAATSSIRLHNYPASWADYYDRNALGLCDPVHRASQVTSIGFRWSRLPTLIALTRADHRMLKLGHEWGLDDGFTIPVNVPGEAHGSCTFASSKRRPIRDAILPWAQLAGAFAFEGARRVWSSRHQRIIEAPALTDRQRDCLVWAARGKSDWEISRILGISEETVVQHVKQARERYGVQKRTSLIIRALYDGTVTFEDVLDQ